MSSPGGVYIVHAVGSNFYKIGVSTNVYKRLKSIQTGCPYEVRVSRVWVGAGPKVEQRLHRQFQRWHYRGEWFEFDDEARKLLADIFNGQARLVDGPLQPGERQMSNRTLGKCQQCGRNVQAKHHYRSFKHKKRSKTLYEHLNCGRPNDRPPAPPEADQSAA